MTAPRLGEAPRACGVRNPTGPRPRGRAVAAPPRWTSAATDPALRPQTVHGQEGGPGGPGEAPRHVRQSSGPRHPTPRRPGGLQPVRAPGGWEASRGQHRCGRRGSPVTPSHRPHNLHQRHVPLTDPSRGGRYHALSRGAGHRDERGSVQGRAGVESWCGGPRAELAGRRFRTVWREAVRPHVTASALGRQGAQTLRPHGGPLGIHAVRCRLASGTGGPPRLSPASRRGVPGRPHMWEEEEAWR